MDNFKKRKKIIEKFKQLYYENDFDEINQIIKSNSINDNNSLLLFFSSYGNLGIVKLLIPYSNPKANKSEALRSAAMNGHLETVKSLITHSDCKAKDSEALRSAVYNGNLEIVELLITHSDCKAKDSEALRLAAYNSNLEIVELLIPHSDIESVINQLNENKDPYYQENIDKSLEIINNYLLNQKLNEELKGFIDNSSNKQKRKI